MPILKLAVEAKKDALPRTEKEPFLPEDVPPSANSEPRPPVGQNRKILVVDDNLVVLKSFELKLRASGFSVTTTSDAAEVASAAESAGSELIILDINFPPAVVGQDWNGFAIMQWLRRFPELARIPVILISGEESEKNKEKSLAEGAIAFFQKPVHYPALLSTMLRALGIEK